MSDAADNPLYADRVIADLPELPTALSPTVPQDNPAGSLVKVGEVFGQAIYTSASVASQIDAFKTANKERWPTDALRATILAIRMGMKPRPSYREIAKMLNMSERHVLRAVSKSKREALIDREITRLEREGVPMAVENVLEGLQAGDREYTLETLKGRGVLRPKGEALPASEGAQAPAQFTGLVVQFIHDGNAAPLKPGTIKANPNRALAPAVIDAEVSKR